MKKLVLLEQRPVSVAEIVVGHFYLMKGVIRELGGQPRKTSS